MTRAQRRRKADRKGAKLMRKAGIAARRHAASIDPARVNYIVSKRNERLA